MNIIARGLVFLQYLGSLSQRTSWDWRHCPQCGGTDTCKWGHYTRRPWFLTGRCAVQVQRHRCNGCRKTYSAQSAQLIRSSWYAREVHRCALDQWQHMGASLRRTAEVLRSWLGHQERWRLWRPLDPEHGEHCYLAARTVHRWLDTAGQTAKASAEGQLAGIAHTQAVGTDGLWTKLKGRAQRVALLLAGSVSGLVYPPLVAKGEASARRNPRPVAQRTAGSGPRAPARLLPRLAARDT
jgi:transposase-like protein